MAYELFLARRLRSASNKAGLSKAIIRLSIFCIATGLAVMIVSSAMVRGFKKDVSKKIFDFWGHIYVGKASYQTFDPDPIAFDQAIVDSIASIAGLTFGSNDRTKGGVEHVQTFIQYPCIVSANDEFEGLFAKGIGPDFRLAFFEDYLKAGRLPRLDSAVSRDAMISQYTADRLELDIGDKMILHFPIQGRQIRRQFKVAAIYNTGLGEYDEKVFFVDLRALRSALKWEDHQISGLEVFVDDLEDTELINDYIYTEILPTDQYSRTIQDRYGAIFVWLQLQDVNERIILGLMLLVVLINMCTTLFILVLERLPMIGTLRALGASNWSIRKIFLMQAGHILVKGVGLGLTIGLVFCYLQKKFRFIKLRESDYYLSYAPIDVNFIVIVVITLLTFVLTISVLIGPTYLINRLTVTRTLRFT